MMIIMWVLKYSYIVPETILFSIITIEIVRYIKINNGILTFVGTQSLSFYLYQILFLFVGLEIGLYKNWIIYGFFVFGATYLLAYFNSLQRLKSKKNKKFNAII